MHVKKLCKSFDGNVVLDNLSLEFRDNAITCIMGKSGCGKTTLLNILMGLVPADSGEIGPAFRGNIGAVFQENRLCERLSAAANIKMVCSKDVSDDDIFTALSAVGIDNDSFFKPASELSGGMQRRAAIVRAVMADNDILIFDEAFKGLDSDTLGVVISYVLANRKNRTLISVTHNMSEISMLGADVLELNSTRI